jgi:serine protease inhibitor
MKNVMRFLLVFTVVFAVACGGGKTNDPVIRDLTQTEQKLVESSNLFGFNLMKEVVAQSDGGNVFISPLSVSFALGMTYNGARGTTEEGMRAALEYGDLTVEEINQSYRDLIDMLCGLDPKVKMEIANSIWIREGFEVLQEFIDVNRTFFDAVVQVLDFSDPGAADVINAWVNEKTHGKIKDIVAKPISAVTVMFLINAIYFKGTWTTEFDPANTSDGTFHAPEGDQVVKMMHLHDRMSYQDNADFQAVNLPYGDGMFSMTLLLPKPGKDLDELIGDLSGENWSAWLAAFYPQEGDLYLPRFELEYETSLNDVLAALGMEVAFTGGADFTGINPGGGLFISNVKHKTYVKVNEEGTEAAAVTSVEIGYESEPLLFNLRVDRPFLFVIHDAHSSALLFVGKIVDPPSE